MLSYAVKLRAKHTHTHRHTQDSFELIPTCDTAIWDISFDSWKSHLAIPIPRPYARVLVLRQQRIVNVLFFIPSMFEFCLRGGSEKVTKWDRIADKYVIIVFWKFISLILDYSSTKVAACIWNSLASGWFCQLLQRAAGCTLPIFQHLQAILWSSSLVDQHLTKRYSQAVQIFGLYYYHIEYR